MSAVAAVVVVVPARDERAGIGGCLAALQVAATRLRRERGLAARVVVVLDDCHDGTGEIVRHRADAGLAVEAFEVAVRCVGAARRAGSAQALATASAPPSAVWTAHTDADSVVPADWLVGMVDLATAGAGAVVGTVVPGPGLDAGRAARWHRAHPPGEDHGHVFGANLGVRGDLLTAVGGWRALVTGEDEDLVARLRAHPGAAVVQTATIPVTTSVRLDGRAPAGFAGYLRELTAG